MSCDPSGRSGPDSIWRKSVVSSRLPGVFWIFAFIAGSTPMHPAPRTAEAAGLTSDPGDSPGSAGDCGPSAIFHLLTKTEADAADFRCEISDFKGLPIDGRNLASEISYPKSCI